MYKCDVSNLNGKKSFFVLKTESGSIKNDLKKVTSIIR